MIIGMVSTITTYKQDVMINNKWQVILKSGRRFALQGAVAAADRAKSSWNTKAFTEDRYADDRPRGPQVRFFVCFSG